jgi:sugar lactone lactonase YvrE
MVRNHFVAFILASLCCVPCVKAQTDDSTAYSFTTLAGYPGIGSDDGIAGLALFFSPEGLALDTSGNMYVADTGNSTIRKISSGGVVTTLAGWAGNIGHDDGLGRNARFYGPRGVALDSAENLYVADSNNQSIRLISPIGTVTTLAYLPGRPVGIASDHEGNLYVADETSHTVCGVDSGGRVTVLAGSTGVPGSADGLGPSARFKSPTGLAVDAARNVYVADSGNGLIRKLTRSTTNWIVSTIVGSAGQFGSTDGANATAKFGFVFSRGLGGISVGREGDIYVADTANNSIRKISPFGVDWVVSTFAGFASIGGSFRNATGTNATFFIPGGVAVDNAGNTYVADAGNSAIRKITSAGVVTTFAGAAGNREGSVDGAGGFARFSFPSSVAVDSGANIYVGDTVAETIRQITPSGVVTTIAGLTASSGSADGSGSDARFSFPYGVVTDNGGNVYVADDGNHTIRKISSAGRVTTIAGLANNPGSEDGINSAARFNRPRGIAIDSGGTIYVSEYQNFTIRKITPIGLDWVVSSVAGLAKVSGSADGTNSNARFETPLSIVVDGATNLYVADAYNYTIRKVIFTGTDWIVSTIAGLAGSSGIVDGTNSTARFSFPGAVALDDQGDLYVADDTAIRKLRSFGTNWVVTTIAGGHSQGFANGTGVAAMFQNALGIAVDNSGSIYVADYGNNTIRKGTFTQYIGAHPVREVLGPAKGQLTLNLSPDEANGQWRFPWELGWRNSGAPARNLPTGNYPVEFRNRPGWLAFPAKISVQVIEDGVTALSTNVYYPTLLPDNNTIGGGVLTVLLGATPPKGAGWRFLGDTTLFLPSGYSTNLLPGIYLIEFAGPFSGRSTPPTTSVQVAAGDPTVISVNYPLSGPVPAGVLLPSAVDLAHDVNDVSAYPFGFNGQLRTDNGYGSGVAVQTNVVLTAAHLVFNDQTLSYVNEAYWFLRRDTPFSEPLPQEARGFYLLSGYAAQRANDLASGYSPDQSTPSSRNLDVAALYFLQPVAAGGYGGYLPSDAVPNTWLSSTALKMLVGYPVDGSQFGDASIVPGKMYQTHPQPYPLSLSPDPVPGQQQVYFAPWLLSFPGNSGGPFYVQLNGYYYPAAVYLGTLFSGSQPYASVVRAIDSSVTNLIQLAALQGDSGTNNTGGGVITFIPSVALSAQSPGYVQVKLGPPEAVKAGAAWRLDSTPTSAFGSDPKYTLVVTSSNAAVVFKPALGWNLPANQTVTITPGRLTVINATYTPAALPILTARLLATQSVEISWPATAIGFALQSSDDLARGTNWNPVVGVPSLAGDNLTVNVPINMAAGFYRLVRP